MPRESGAFRSASFDEPGQGLPAQGPLGAAVRAALGLRALSRRASRAAWPDRVLSRRLRHRAGAADRRLAARACRCRADRAAVRPSPPRHDQHVRHVPQFRGAGAAAAGRRDRDLVRGASDHRRLRRVVSRRARPRLSLVRGRGRLRRHHRDAVALPQLRAIRIRRLGDRRRHRRRRSAACSPPSPTPVR